MCEGDQNGKGEGAKSCSADLWHSSRRAVGRAPNYSTSIDGLKPCRPPLSVCPLLLQPSVCTSTPTHMQKKLLDTNALTKAHVVALADGVRPVEGRSCATAEGDLAHGMTV